MGAVERSGLGSMSLPPLLSSCLWALLISWPLGLSPFLILGSTRGISSIVYPIFSIASHTSGLFTFTLSFSIISRGVVVPSCVVAAYWPSVNSSIVISIHGHSIRWLRATLAYPVHSRYICGCPGMRPNLRRSISSWLFVSTDRLPLLLGKYSFAISVTDPRN